jgi:hypothetical protein
MEPNVRQDILPFPEHSRHLLLVYKESKKITL